MERKLAAILYADVAGYSRLTGEDEEGTHRTLSAYLDAITAAIENHDGRVVHYAGDAVLAEFASVVVAVTCAAEIQRDLAARNEGLAEERKLQFRIGINLGDVMVDRNDIYGDGVNVAARLESLADPGGICVSASVHDQVRNKLDLGYESLGEQKVKNIAEPVTAYRVLLNPCAAKPVTSTFQSLPDRPSVAVLPFDNMSADAEQEFLADGITEDIITALSKISGLFIIARNSTFTYKGRSVDVREVGRELGVRYVLEGSVRRSGNRVRITAQLVDGSQGEHLWAAKFDRTLADVFALQDEITANVVNALHVRLVEGEQARVWHRSTENFAAWECLTVGLGHFRHFTQEENAQARRMFEKAVELDPDYAAAWTRLAWTHWTDVRFLWAESRDQALERAASLADKALALDNAQADVHALMGGIHLVEREFDAAVAACEKAVELEPNGADVTALLAMTLNWSGRPGEAIGLVEKAMRLSPLYSAWYLAVLAHAYRLMGRHEEAIATYRESIARNPDNIGPRLGLTASCIEVGRDAEAGEQAAEVLRINPRFSLEKYAGALTYKDPEHAKRSLDALRKAGLPA